MKQGQKKFWFNMLICIDLICEMINFEYFQET